MVHQREKHPHSSGSLASHSLTLALYPELRNECKTDIYNTTSELSQKKFSEKTYISYTNAPNLQYLFAFSGVG